MAVSGLVVGEDFGTSDRVEGIGSGHEGGVGLMAGEDGEKERRRVTA